ncbi:hypothetical protein DZA65_02452 [Dickeya dianthicola]|uniref:Uncharacterized protein n=1 Tax=Dickeya dianthicola TaxID=204039 RepID=A0AAP6RW22_9GAMM|nr:hypothetical protein [Dickeya dianthicola]MBQ4796877.1 hypothetical protein [Pectobacterium versatile]ATO33437.1 hypothetical protein DDI_2269 [Dickeya dianthicola RNS04.9]AYC19339.1 hypothetical protein DZA65_02452 [Dickeya dianthicola]MBI0437747.1 hypothetical protein [Dickeya dianthicola]MBI0450784.1 hypothetical protein [Dickeya dianthicola]
MEQTENQELTLSRIRLIADMSLISQCNPEEMKIAMSLIADLSHRELPDSDYQQFLKNSSDGQQLKAWFEQQML